MKASIPYERDDGTEEQSMKGWHFTSDTLRDGRPLPADGEWLEHEGRLVICKSGLHFSERIIDALRYAPGSTICRVEAEGCEAQGHDDKHACRRRKILWRIDGESALREFARKCALDVIHLWDPPDVVRRYLETGDESLRTAACGAAWAACGAAWAAAWAAEAAAWAAANGITVVRAALAARNGAWVASRSATSWATETVNTARDAQNTRLDQMVRDAR